MALLLNANDSVNRSYTITKPSPNHPLDVNGVGVRTKNLFDVDDSVGGYLDNNGLVSPAADAMRTTGYVPVTPNTTYTITATGSGRIKAYNQSKGLLTRATYNDYGISLNSTNTFTTDSNTYFIRFSFQPNKLPIMLNTGSTAKPYEPYGYKIPISNGQQTTNIYLGSTQATRQIKKLVLTGEESWSYLGGSVMPFRVKLAESMQLPTRTDIFWICSHFTSISHDVAAESGNQMSQFICWHPNDNQGYLRFRDIDAETLAAFQQWLAAQYANGTPVTVWYVLATAETAAVNEPLMKISNYADTLSNATAIPTTEGANSITVDTTVQPSEFTATWAGWHDANVKEWDGSQWNE